MSEILLDTCTCLWLMDGSLTEPARAELDQRIRRGEEIHVSAVSAWEIGMLFSHRRLVSPLRPSEYWRRLMDPSFMAYTPGSAAAWLESSSLPGEPPVDPWDRLLASIAREHGLTLMTRDRRLLAYAETGHLLAVAC